MVPFGVVRGGVGLTKHQSSLRGTGTGCGKSGVPGPREHVGPEHGTLRSGVEGACFSRTSLEGLGTLRPKSNSGPVRPDREATWLPQEARAGAGAQTCTARSIKNALYDRHFARLESESIISRCANQCGLTVDTVVGCHALRRIGSGWSVAAENLQYTDMFCKAILSARRKVQKKSGAVACQCRSDHDSR